MKGTFVISLDYELHWGFFDNRDLESSKERLLQVDMVINKLLDICNTNEVKITFATVGFLFAKSKNDIHSFTPKIKPNYTDKSLNPYSLIETIGDSEKEAPYYYAPSGIQKIKDAKVHEIGSHTFSHYYCNEAGQTPEHFEADLKSAIAIAKASGITIKSMVFPRNQAQLDCVAICQKLGLTSYRGSNWFNFNNANKKLKLIDYPKLILRVLDTYLNLTGSNAFNLEDHNDADQEILNIPSSKFLRPYNYRLRALEKLKIRRIKRSMTKAAKQGEIYHLWWHPHNFAEHLTENFENLNEIVSHYKKLNTMYDFQSMTMSEIASDYTKK